MFFLHVNMGCVYMYDFILYTILYYFNFSKKSSDAVCCDKWAEDWMMEKVVYMFLLWNVKTCLKSIYCCRDTKNDIFTKEKNRKGGQEAHDGSSAWTNIVEF